MKDKLTIEELCGYLPYGLQFLSHKHRIKYGHQTVLAARGMSLCDDLSLNVEFMYEDDLVFSNEMKTSTPLLLPLSALTEPLPNGETPIVELAKIAFPKDEWIIDAGMRCSISDGWASPKSFVFHQYGFMCGENNRAHSVSNQLRLFQYLYKNHFDLHNLIERGLALDKRKFLK